MYSDDALGAKSKKKPKYFHFIREKIYMDEYQNKMTKKMDEFPP